MPGSDGRAEAQGHLQRRRVGRLDPVQASVVPRSMQRIADGRHLPVEHAATRAQVGRTSTRLSNLKSLWISAGAPSAQAGRGPEPARDLSTTGRSSVRAAL
jgi:hypothetical protein